MMKPYCVNRRLILAALTVGAGATMAARGTMPTGVDPRHFGARGIGAEHDDTGAIQAAIDAAWNAGGGIVRFAATPKYYNVTRPLLCRPGVSLAGDGGWPTIRTTKASVNLLLAGNFHPDFIARASYDPARPVTGRARAVVLERAGDARRYRVGDQVLVTSRNWGQAGGFAIPHYAWLNIVQRVEGARLILREGIDRAMPVQVTRLADTLGRDGIPLFFHADATITGLRLEAIRHVMSDSAMLRVTVTRNRMRARSGIYGNTFQHVLWEDNDFAFTHAAGEQSLNSFRTLATRNRFRFVPGASEPQSAGFYFQEYARDLLLDDNSIDMGDFPGKGFLISITGAQGVRVRRLAARGRMRNLLYMGAPGDPDFTITGNEIAACRFDVAGCDRLVFVDGRESPHMHGNRIAGCTFAAPAAVRDGVRVQALRGAFALERNRWTGGVRCYSMRRSQGLLTTDNLAGSRAAACLAIS